MIGASRIPKDIREIVVSMYHGCCGVHGCTEKAIEIHHILSNSKSANKQYKLFTQSPINLLPICRRHHLQGEILVKVRWNGYQATLWEKYLESLTMCEKCGTLK